MRRFTSSPTQIRITETLRPMVSRIKTLFSTWYSKLCRNRSRQRQLIAISAGVAAVVFLITIVQLQSQRQKLAAHFTVLVATGDITTGEQVTADVVRTLLVPASLVTSTIIVDLPGSAYAIQNIGAGELITSINVADRSMATSVVPIGWRTIAITSPTALPPMSPGDHVDVIANGMILAANAVVVSTSGELLRPNDSPYITHVVIGVPPDAAPSVA
ncbi:MAG: hypothetical protein AAB327_09225, partial [Actinomycetota bacterium]